jgi:hypothetical protein
VGQSHVHGASRAWSARADAERVSTVKEEPPDRRHQGSQGRQYVLVGGRRVQDVVRGDRHGVELHAAAGREPLPERVGVAVDHHAREGGIHHDGAWLARVTPHRPHGEAVGDQDARGKALTAGQQESLPVPGECQSRFLTCQTTTPAPLLRHGPPRQPVGESGLGEEPGAPRHEVVTAEQLTYRPVGRGDLPDHRVRRGPVRAAASLATASVALVVRGLAGTRSQCALPGPVRSDSAAEPDGAGATPMAEVSSSASLVRSSSPRPWSRGARRQGRADRRAPVPPDAVTT